MIIVIAGASTGSILVSFSGGGGGSAVGDGLIAASVAAAALYVVIASRLVASVRPLPAALTQQAWALGFVLLCGAAVSGGQLWPVMTGQGLLLAAASGVLNYAMPFWLYLSALTRMAVARAATYLTLIPVFGVLGSVLVLRERLTWLDGLGGLLVVGSLLLDATAGARTDRAPGSRRTCLSADQCSRPVAGLR
jgi:drug/metabolite transporter (DMT)-like permease